MTQPLHRRSIRLPEVDYTQPGAYFITLVTFNRAHLFGEIEGSELHPSPLESIARREWFKTTELRPYIALFDDEFVIMPNHIHGIIHFHDQVDAANHVGVRDVGAQRRCAPTQHTTDTTSPQPAHPSADQPLAVLSGSLGAVVRAYKSAVTYVAHQMNLCVGAPIWQRNYYEHVVRNELDLLRIQEYILNNPVNWSSDSENHQGE